MALVIFLCYFDFICISFLGLEQNLKVFVMNIKNLRIMNNIESDIM